MDQRLQFVHNALSNRFTMSELCARCGISRRIGYKCVARYAEEGRRGLQDRNRAPFHCPHRMDEAVATLLCEVRKAHPFWGARKLLATTTEPNDLWTADFKGHFRTGDTRSCYPLTIADRHTRYLRRAKGSSRRKPSPQSRLLSAPFASTDCHG